MTPVNQRNANEVQFKTSGVRRNNSWREDETKLQKIKVVKLGKTVTYVGHHLYFGPGNTIVVCQC